MITTDNNGFEKAGLYTKCLAEIHAKLNGCGKYFDVVLYKDSADGWAFGEDACREAAEFFIKLADELKRRKDEA